MQIKSHIKSYTNIFISSKLFIINNLHTITMNTRRQISVADTIYGKLVTTHTVEYIVN